MRIKFSESYCLLQILTLKAELASLPNVKLGTLRGKQVVRVYTRENNRLVFKTHFADSTEGLRLSGTAQRRIEIRNEIKRLEQRLGKRMSGMLDRLCVRLSSCILNESVWNECQNNENTMKNNGNYCHKGIQMRSRVEVLIAEILDELGLQYKYEPAVRFGEEVYYPDFLVYLPCLKRCLIIEFFGMSDEEKYVFKMLGKLTVYSNNGLIMNRDVIGLYGTRDVMVSSDYIYNNIVTIINLLAAEAVQLK